MTTGIISGLALVVAAYGVWLARRVAQRDERLEAKKRASEIRSPGARDRLSAARL
jgi:hypothetical protein